MLGGLRCTSDQDEEELKLVDNVLLGVVERNLHACSTSLTSSWQSSRSYPRAIYVAVTLLALCLCARIHRAQKHTHCMCVTRCTYLA